MTPSQLEREQSVGETGSQWELSDAKLHPLRAHQPASRIHMLTFLAPPPLLPCSPFTDISENIILPSYQIFFFFFKERISPLASRECCKCILGHQPYRMLKAHFPVQEKKKNTHTI